MSSFSNDNHFQKASTITNNNTPTFFKINLDNLKINSSNSFNSSSNWTTTNSTNNNINPFILNKKETNNPFSMNNNNLNNNNQCNNYNNNTNSQLNNIENGKNNCKNNNSNINFFSSNNNDLNKQNLNPNLHSNTFMMKESNNNFSTNPFILNNNSQNSFSVNNNLNAKCISNYSQSFISLNNPFSQNNNNYNNNNNSISNINQKTFNNNIINSTSYINTYNNENIVNNFIPNNYYSSSNNFSNFNNQNNFVTQNDRNYNQNNCMTNNSYLNNQMKYNIENNYSNQNNFSNTQFHTNLNQFNNNNQTNFISNNRNQHLNCENNLTNKNLINGNFIQNTNQTMFQNLLNDFLEQDTMSYINSYSQFYGNYTNVNNISIPTNFINLIEEKSEKKEISKNKIINISLIKENEFNKNNQDENIKLFIQDLKSNKIKKEEDKYNNYNNNYSLNFFQFPNFNQYQKNKNRKLKIQNIKESIPKTKLKPNTKFSIITKQAKQFVVESTDLNQDNKENEKTKPKIEYLINDNLRDKFKHPIGNTPEKLKKEFNLINIYSYIPICTKYQLIPKIEKLSVMREKDLQSINNFSILSNDIKITFKNSLNLINLNLDKFIISNNYDISIEDDKLKRILGPVIIEIYNVFLDENNNEMVLNSILSKFKTNEYKYNSEFQILSFETDLNKLIN
jgi:hypothetical protein